MDPLYVFLIYLLVSFVLRMVATLLCGDDNEDCVLYSTAAVNVVLVLTFGYWFYTLGK
jgi:hypothetical protein